MDEVVKKEAVGVTGNRRVMFYNLIERARLIWIEEVVNLDYSCYALILKRRIAELEKNLRMVDSMLRTSLEDEEIKVILSKLEKRIHALLGIWDVEVESLEDNVYCPSKALRLKMFKTGYNVP